MHIVGEIKNVASGSATSVEVIATYYDSSGKVVATNFTNPSAITPGSSAPFDILLTETSRVLMVNRYSLTAESTEYTVVSEFSVPPMFVATLISLGALFLVLRKRMRRGVEIEF
jgi:hypothetical protein